MDDDKALKELAAVLAASRDKGLIEDFLSSLLTPSEIHEVATRWALVKLINEGVPQRKIAQTLGLSLCKITRGSREFKKDRSPFRAMIDLESRLD